MDEYINREVLISKIEKARLYISEREKVPYKACLKEYVEFLKMIPAADVVPRSEFEAYAKNQEDTIKELVDELEKVERKHGKWVQAMGKYDWMVKCSRCNGIPIETSDFCPNCGADMRGKEDG